MRRKSEKPKANGSAKKAESGSRCLNGDVISESCRDENDGSEGVREVSYMPAYAGVAKKILEPGETESDMDEAFNVSVETIDKWCKEQKDFSEACKQGLGKANSEVQRSVFKMAIGYEYVAEEVRFYQGRVHVVKYCKHVPPDLGAAKVWLLSCYPKNGLTNRSPKKKKAIWRCY